MFFFHVPEGDCNVLEAQKTTLSSKFGMSLFRFLFLSELGTCSQIFMPTRGVEPWEKHQFPQEGMLKLTYKGRFLTTKKHMEYSYIEKLNGGHML
jgi:hypothetical protein